MSSTLKRQVRDEGWYLPIHKGGPKTPARNHTFSAEYVEQSMHGGSLDAAVRMNQVFPGMWIGSYPSLLVAILAREHVTSWWTGRSLTTETSVSSPPPFEKDRVLFRLRDTNLIGLRRSTTFLWRPLGFKVWWKRNLGGIGTYHAGVA